MGKGVRTEDPGIDFLDMVCLTPGTGALHCTGKRTARYGQVAHCGHQSQKMLGL